jgi:hypothetical protein
VFDGQQWNCERAKPANCIAGRRDGDSHRLGPGNDVIFVEQLGLSSRDRSLGFDELN